jgi:DNA-binding NarL/FixJ family response regulator
MPGPRELRREYNQEMRAIVAVADLLTRSRIEEAGRAAGYEVAVTRGLSEPEDVDLLIVDLDQPGTIEEIERWRTEKPQTRVVGFAFHVNEETIRHARALGAKVLPHGATAQPAQFFG